MRGIVPPGVAVVPVWPGKTLGGLALLSYESGSTLRYHELCVVAALVRVGWKFGFWLTALYVDSDASRWGGRAIWTLRKRGADFVLNDRRKDVLVNRRGSQRPVCRVVVQATTAQPRVRIPLFAPLPAFAFSQGRTTFFTAFVRARVELAHTNLQAPTDGLISRLFGDGRPLISVSCDALRLRVPAQKRRGESAKA